MKRILLFLVCIIGFCIISKAQIAPPKQTDTLIITSVKYNYADIDQENWPCGVIYKSTTSFIIGDSEFPIISAYMPYDEVTFTVTGDDGETQYKLVYKELGYKDKYSGEIVIKFSGYEFRCCKKHQVIEADDVIIDMLTFEDPEYNGPSVLSYTLDGRKASHLPIPAYRCYGDGDVTVIITVNPQGQVTNAQIMDDISSPDDCLRKYAIRAARLSRFSASSTAPAKQTGEITYRFSFISNSIVESSEANAKLAGRTVNGTLPRPSHGVQISGKVVVDIWVDNYGNVQKAVPGAEGTTVTDKTLWQAVRTAALGAHFNMSTEAPALQKGTITYNFGHNSKSSSEKHLDI